MKEAIEKKQQQRKWKVIIICFIGILSILFIGNVILNRVVQNKVRENLEQLSPLAKVDFSSIHANLFASSLSINNLAIQFKPDTADLQHQHFFHFPKAEFTGIDFFYFQYAGFRSRFGEFF